MATYSYNARNQIASTTIENGLFTATRSYDTAGRLTGVSNGALDSTSYTLSPGGRRTGITRNGDTENYGYDNARQVISGTYGGLSTTQSWNYDPAGNRLTAVTNGSTTNYTPNAVNAYTSITGGGHVPPPPTNDPNGNATTCNVRPLGSSGLESSVFAWNINNELTSATNSTGDSASYAYDALGCRIKRTETINGTTTTTWFFYNGWNVELEHNGTAYTRRHTWGLDLSNSLQGAGGVGGLLMVEHLNTGTGTPEPYFPTYDGNGNITAWVDATGTVTARQRYDAFGNILSQTGVAPSNYAFSTKPKERVTGLCYYGYRFYDPVAGRWINRDPIEEDGGVNLYAFLGNATAGSFDDLGQKWSGSWKCSATSKWEMSWFVYVVYNCGGENCLFEREFPMGRLKGEGDAVAGHEKSEYAKTLAQLSAVNNVTGAITAKQAYRAILSGIKANSFMKGCSISYEQLWMSRKRENGEPILVPENRDPLWNGILPSQWDFDCKHRPPPPDVVPPLPPPPPPFNRPKPPPLPPLPPLNK